MCLQPNIGIFINKYVSAYVCAYVMWQLRIYSSACCATLFHLTTSGVKRPAVSVY